MGASSSLEETFHEASSSLEEAFHEASSSSFLEGADLKGKLVF